MSSDVKISSQEISHWKHRTIGWWSGRLLCAISAALVGAYGWSLGFFFPLAVWVDDCHFTTCDSPTYLLNQKLVLACLLAGACFGATLGFGYGLNRTRFTVASWQPFAMKIASSLGIATAVSPIIVDKIGGADLAYHCTNLEDRTCDAFYLVGWLTILLLGVLCIAIETHVRRKAVMVQ